jgi:hypothetical protein
VAIEKTQWVMTSTRRKPSIELQLISRGFPNPTNTLGSNASRYRVPL